MMVAWTRFVAVDIVCISRTLNIFQEPRGLPGVLDTCDGLVRIPCFFVSFPLVSCWNRVGNAWLVSEWGGGTGLERMSLNLVEIDRQCGSLLPPDMELSLAILPQCMGEEALREQSVILLGKLQNFLFSLSQLLSSEI